MSTFRDVLNKILPSSAFNYLRSIRYSISANKSLKSVEKELAVKHKKLTGKIMDWSNPQTYTEKVIFSKIYDADDYRAKLTDKGEIRKWVSSKIGESYLVPIYGIYDSFEDIDFESLPRQFVIKCTHDSGSVVVVKDKTKININALKKLYKFYLKRNFAYMTYEMHYKNIPHRIIIEKYMGNSINDYKFLCFDSKPLYCWVDIDRFSNHKRNIYDLNWQLQPFNQFTYGNSEKPVQKPEQFDEMLKIASTLCQGFEHVRVDLYLVEGKIYFGEMTFTNGSGNEIITPPEWDDKLGALWKVDVSKRNRHDRTKKMRDYIVDKGE